MTKYLLLFLFLLLVPPTAFAQTAVPVPITPNALTFQHPDADFAITTGYTIEYYRCGSLSTAGLCVGRATAAFQVGNTIPKAAVTGVANARTIDLSKLNVFTSLPAGVPFVMALTAVGDKNAGATGDSGRSLDSNAFFALGRNPAIPDSLVVR